jgi:hypothetical protein
MATPAGLAKGGDEEFGVVLAAQWPARARPTGAKALGLALIEGAVRDAGLLARSDKSTRPAHRVLARAYLAGRSDGSEPVPLETACALIGVNPDRVRRAVLRRLGPGDAP